MSTETSADSPLNSSRLDILHEIPVFGGIDDAALRFLLRRITITSVAAGQMFFEEHDQGQTMYVLESGVAAIIKRFEGRDYPLKKIGPGDCFGEMALIDFYPRSASVLAVSDCTAMELSLAVLHELYAEDLKQFTLIQMNIGREVSRRLRVTSEQLFRERLKNDGQPKDQGIMPENWLFSA